MMALRTDVESEIAALEAHLSEPDFTTEDLLEAEKTLRRAFRSTVQGSASSSEFFHGTYRTENKKLKDAKLPQYLIDPERPNERRDRWATQVHSKESTAHFSKPPVDQQGYLFTSVHAVVNDLPEKHLVFIKSQYMPACASRSDFLHKFLSMMWDDYQTNLTPRINRAVIHVFAQVIVATCGAEDKFLLAGIRAKFSDRRDTWKRHYLPHWRALQADFVSRRRDSLIAFLSES